ncbi:MAG: helix-hairpin-helix domain-containing protein [Methanobacterium sp.]
MDHEDLHFTLKNKKCKILDEMWNFTQKYLDHNLKDCMECIDELEVIEKLEKTEKFKSFLIELECIKDDLNKLYMDFLEKNCVFDLKKEKIIALKEKFKDEISTSEIVNAVNCSRGYARQFYVMEDQVVQKEKRSGLSKKTKDLIIKRDDNSCVACGCTETLEIHHIMPIMGSSIKELNNPVNLAVLCNNCHYLAHRGNYYKSLAYKDNEDFWKWVENTERTKIWLVVKDITGIGIKISENLYDKFKSVEELRKADIRDLTRVPLVNKSLASKIKFKFQNSI